MIITADTIRRFPFAVAPHRITDDLQALIAQDMAEQAHKEGHRKAVPPTLVDKDAMREGTRRRIRAQVLACLQEHGPKHMRGIREIICRDNMGVTDALAYLEAIGAITSHQRKNRGGGVSRYYRLTHSPIQGACDPAQPGNPTGERSDVTRKTVVAVSLTPGALNQPPATQEAAE